MKEEGTALADHTTAPVQSACPDVNAFYKCGPTLMCKTAQCECRKAAHVCVFCQCLGQCLNVAPQTQRDKQRTTQGANTEEMGTGKQKRRCRLAKGKKKQTQAESEGKENGPIGDTPTPPLELQFG